MPDKTAMTTAWNLYQVFADFGVPAIVQSDNGREFINQVVDRLRRYFQFQHHRITPYHPQANGAAESHVKLAKSLLRKLTNQNKTLWSRFVPSVQATLNLRIPRRHFSTPFELFFAMPKSKIK